MAVVKNISIALLAALSALGFYHTLYKINHNGTAHKIDATIKAGKLPGSNQPLLTQYTHIPYLDGFLTTLVTFFYPLVDWSHPAGSLQLYHFMGQIAAAWGLLTIESLRKGHSWRFVSYITLWGLAIQAVMFAVVGPILLITHLLTSPTISNPKIRDLELEKEDILSIFPAIFIGFVIPTVLMAMPVSFCCGYDTKQILICIWQFFPVWVLLARSGISSIVKLLQPRTSTSRAVNSFKYLRGLYAILLAVSVWNHLSTAQVLAESYLE